MRRLLFVSRNLACPDFHGGCVYPYRVLEALSRHGFAVEYLWIPEKVSQRPFRLPFRPAFCRRVFVAGAFQIGPTYWQNPLQGRDLKRALNGWIQSPGDVVVLDYLWDAELLQGLPASTWILTHERMYRRSESYQAAGVVPDFKVLGEAEERRLLEAAKGLIAIQEEDASWMRQSFPDKPVVVVPPPFSVSAVEENNNRGDTVLFIGGRTAHNRGALEWLVGEVWPRVIARKPDARLRVYGTVDISGLGNAKGLDFRGAVEDLSRAYGENAIAVVPVRFGSGLKLKLLEAFAHALPVVATSVGAEGFAEVKAGTICPVSDDPEAYAQNILRLFNEPGFQDAVRQRQFEWLKVNADPALLGRRFADAIASYRT
ncbi:MAG: glycosyltransferase family 4 protein [Opitutales bacterium]|nr:glycosyltransferase family 4 protein [Opitutales bacterium]